MKPIRMIAACVIVVAAASRLAGQEVASLPETDPLVRQTLTQLDNAGLTARQVAQIQELAAKWGPAIRSAEQKAGFTAAQRRARDEAMARAVDQHLSGPEARKLLTGAATRSDEQKAALASASRLRREFDQAAFGLLTEAQRPERQEPPIPERARNGFLIVELSPSLPLPPRSAKTLRDAAIALNLPNLRAAIDKHGLLMSERAIQPDLLDRLEDAKNPSGSAEIRLLRTFWQIDARRLPRRSIDPILKNLNDLAEVKVAYAALRTTQCSTGSPDPTDNPYYPFQGYLLPAPLGIDAAAAWSLKGGQGAGVSLADLECSWNIDHEDLKHLLQWPVYGDILPHDDHGTSVVGEIMGHNNTVGIIGAAPGIDSVTLTSVYHAGTGQVDAHVANALTAALAYLSPGDVFLIEQELSPGYPVEIESLNFNAIRLAVSRGLVVIEPTGNGRLDLDAYQDQGMAILNRHSSSFRDSGAIIVGASDPMHGHIKAHASDYGSRVDCFGWGNYVVTTSNSSDSDILDSGGGDNNKSYRRRFNATSSAAPIVAGAALLVQGLSKSRYGLVLSSTQMREILSNPWTGTPQGRGVPGHIGVMPNLKAILAANGLADGSPWGPGLMTGECQGGFRCCATRTALRSFRARRR